MSTSSPPRTPATGFIAVDWRRPRRRWVRVGIILLAIAVAATAWTVLHEESGPGLAGRAVVTASSTRPGYAAHAAVDAGDPRSPKAQWRSNGETVGARLDLAWPEKHELQQVVLVRNPLAEPGVTAGFLSFGDGSQLQVALSSTSVETVVPFSPRIVDRVRFTASAVSDGASDVRVAEILVATSTGGLAVGLAGNAAVDARVTASGGSDPHALQDGTDGDRGAAWTVDTPSGSWVQLDWDRPQEIASVALVGSAGSLTTLSKGTLIFGDGAPLPVGAVLTEPTRPTVIGFMPRITRSLRLTLNGVEGLGPLVLSELQVYRRGATPSRTPTAVVPPIPMAEPACPAPQATPAVPAGKLVVSCPTSGSTVDGIVSVRVAAPGFSSVTASAWPADAAGPASAPVRVNPDPAGFADLAVDVGVFPPGPVTVRIEAMGGERPATAYLSLYRRGLGVADMPSSSAAQGRTLVYAEEFNRPLSITRSGAGADYAAAKPVHDGVQDFGDAIFADPGVGFDNVRVVDDRYLRIDVEPTQPGYPDPQGWGRTHLGGLLASARPGGSGFSAQYGYFEARMLMPASPGTWPAFWMLPSDNLIAPTPVVAEIDAIESYGFNPTAACNSTHDYNSPHDDGVARCGTRFDSDRAALSWHTYGVSVMPSGVTFYIDGQVVATAPQIDGGGAPMFFLVNLALGGGWPVDLAAVQDRATLYVDYIRVYV